MSVATMTHPRLPQNMHHPAGNVKKQLRDTQRMLARPSLPADVRREQERKLAALQIAAVDRQKGEQERKMATAYRMVRFFERKKAERRMKQALKGEDGAAKEQAIMDMNYVLHFPKDRKYIALFPSTETCDERVLEERRNIRDRVNQEIMAKAQVASILEAPLPVVGKAEEDLETGELSVKKALQQANKDSDEDDSDDAEEEEEDDTEDDEEDSEDNSDEDDGSEAGNNEQVNDSDDDSENSDEDSFDSDSDEDDEEDEDTEDDDESDDFDSDDDDEDEEDDESDDESDEDDFDDEDDESDDDDSQSDAPAIKRTRQ